MGLLERMNSAGLSPQVLPPAAPSSTKIVGVRGLDNFSARLVRRAESSAARQSTPQFAEIDRICLLPIVGDITPEEHEEFCRTHLLAQAYDSGWRLWPIQSDAVLAYETYGGLFAPVGVGWGKTLISLMIAQAAFMRGLRKILLLVPSSVYPQLVNSNIPWARTKVPLSVPFHLMGGRTKNDRRAVSRSNRVGCYILPYSMLSTGDTLTVDDQLGLLDAIAPELIIGDEIHYLANRTASRTKRLMNWVTERDPQPQFAVMSGTITAKSVKDYHHLQLRALGRNSPLPLSPQLASEWGQVIDADGYFCDAQAGPLQPLVDWARRNFPEVTFAFDRSGFRKAYQYRLRTAPGVVASGDSEIKTSLTITNQPVPDPPSHKGWERLEELTTQVVEEFVTPNGDEIEHAIHAHKWLKELTAGFYNELIWPTVEMVQKKLGCSEAEAETHLLKARQHHEAHQAYAKALRQWLGAHDIAGADTPMAVGRSMSVDGPKLVGKELYDLWVEMKGMEYDDMPERYGRAVRVCDYKIEACVRWCKELKEGAIVWYQHQEIGKWIVERLREEQIDCLHAYGGVNEALDLDQHPENGDKVLAMSIQAHREGKNLQPMGPTYFLEWNQSARIAEQALGRNHRNGQERDELAPVTCLTTDFDVMSFATSINDALYIQQSMGTRQKLIYCGYSPMPVVYPPDLLTERGFQAHKLTAEQKELIQERFGGFSA